MEIFVDMAGCQKRAQWNLYTDGSKKDGKVGGVYIICGGVRVAEESYRLPDESTRYQAEMVAFQEATSILATIPILTMVKVFVDSQAALRTFQSLYVTSKLALLTILTLNTVKATSLVVCVDQSTCWFTWEREGRQTGEGGHLSGGNPGCWSSSPKQHP